MLVDYFYHLKDAGLPVTIREFLDLLAALKAQVIFSSVDDFYHLSRTCLIKDERLFDRFDQAFGSYFKGIVAEGDNISAEIPEEWLRKQLEKHLSEEEKKKLDAMGWQKLMETLKQRLEEQKERHQGGSKWIGTGGTSPFGAYGYNPEGIRIGQDRSRNRKAVKVWDKREFRNLDDS
ncbi:MAG: VWA domain-containing protein, partial [Sedimenticola sp.]|nr:VWA domain-containing protein [Sedimenticola sp.]